MCSFSRKLEMREVFAQIAPYGMRSVSQTVFILFSLPTALRTVVGISWLSSSQVSKDTTTRLAGVLLNNHVMSSIVASLVTTKCASVRFIEVFLA